jgi:hypothetical protein
MPGRGYQLFPNCSDDLSFGFTAEEFEQTYAARRDSLLTELRRLSGVCKGVVELKVGKHWNFDEVKMACPRFAQGMLKGLSNGPITGTEDGPFRTHRRLTVRGRFGTKRHGPKTCV